MIDKKERNRMFDFKDQVIVVTGAAGNLGQAVAKAFLEAGGTVCALDHRSGRLMVLFSEEEIQGKLHIYEQVDVTDRAGMMALSQRIRDEVGTVDVLVNTVGGFTMGERVDEISAKTWQSMMDINVTSLLNAAAAFVPVMMEAGHGKVVSVGSGASLKGGAKMGAYAAAKSAVLRLTESMAAELKSSHIQANCVLPGTIDTPENREAMPGADTSKWVTPEQVAQAIVFLASTAADGVTGAALPVTGRS
jgi:NAD(P)-dependent dehydrogenase (short-subunit alcohol dehydrogenase family)